MVSRKIKLEIDMYRSAIPLKHNHQRPQIQSYIPPCQPKENIEAKVLFINHFLL